ncbi:hypothetical protein [Paraburkholderia flava]|uniref:hypothetical protein n=1 Tax=Paraburkholderia flava TaxID=2547393 RepID=UPI00106025B0|nr:hypothetical protein [Paraburkholderia flava]
MNTKLGHEFEQFFNNGSIGRALSRAGIKDPLAFSIALRSLSESKKRKNSEDHAGLLDAMLLSAVTQWADEFKDYLTRYRGYRYLAGELLIENTARELRSLAPVVKRYVGITLRWRQEALYEKPEYTFKVGSMLITEHPMKTFNRHSGIIDMERRLKTKPELLSLRWELLCIMRIGDAFFSRDEWEDTVTEVGPNN